jgi:hypothetical protein
MRRAGVIFLAGLLLVCTMVSIVISRESSQQAVEAQASKDADKFLQGLKIADLPEGKQILSKTAWKFTAWKVREAM